MRFELGEAVCTYTLYPTNEKEEYLVKGGLGERERDASPRDSSSKKNEPPLILMTIN